MKISRSKLKSCGPEVLTLMVIILIVFISSLRSALIIMPRKDELGYIGRAEKLLNGEIVISPQHGYFFSILLALVFFLFGDRLVVAQIFTVFLNSLVVIATHFFTKEMFAEKPYRREAGLAAALLVSIGLLDFAVDVRNDIVFLIFFLLACYYVRKGIESHNDLKFAGIFAGLAYLTRDQGILIIPVFIVYLLLNRKDLRTEMGEVKWKKFKFVHQYKSLILMIVAYLLVLAPKLFWKWYLFGNPFYSDQINYFWMDNYEDRWRSSIEYQPSLIHYWHTHTIQEMLNRELKGVYRMIIKLQGLLTFRLVLILPLVVIGLLLFRKRRDLLLHLNLAVLFAVFAWLFGIRPTTRWVVPVVPFFVIPIVGTGFEVASWLFLLSKKFLRSPCWPLIDPKFVQRIVGSLNLLLGNTRLWLTNLRRRLRRSSSLQTLVAVITLLIVFSASLPLLEKKSDEVYSLARKEKAASATYYEELMDLVNWAKTNTPEDATFMTRDGHDLLEYYAHREYIITPNEDLDFIMKVIRIEGVDYLIIDSRTLEERPALEPIYYGKKLPEGFSLVYKNYDDITLKKPKFKIQVYEIQLEP